MFVSGVANGCARKIILLAAFISGVACSPVDEMSAESFDVPPTYVGAASCIICHESEFKLWSDSHHALAMQHATLSTVLGDFSGVEFQHIETTSTFFTRDGMPYVRTDDEEGVLQDYLVKYTFGVTPLQQYLVEFPGGRLQTLPVAWDARSAEEGGQRWFHIYPDEAIPHDDALHWTGREQNWNFMCAECHSTNLAKNYDADTDTYETNWSEINVACEACHGPASIHIVQAESHSFDSRSGFLIDLDDTGRAVWEMNVNTGIAVRSELRMRGPTQPEACGRCHSRRSVASAEYEFGKSLLDTHSPALLDESLYFADGQIREEVYVYGSFLQSRMYQAGVSCSDCHEPHSATLRTGNDPNGVCATCHLPARFANADHHRHPDDSAGCVDCHMPSRDYMVIDGRRDHGFRLPRPDLTLAIGSPNACNQCHEDQDASWALTALQGWYGDEVRDHYGFAIHAARTGAIGGNQLLMETIAGESVPGIARGTALSLIRPPLSRRIARVIQAGLSSPDPFVRSGALEALSQQQPDLRVEWAAPLLNDPLRSIRIAAARIISPLRADVQVQYEGAFLLAERELIDSLHVNGERPEARAMLGNVYADQGDATRAEAEFRAALRREPHSLGSRINLADLYRRLGRDGDAEALLREGIELSADEAALHHSLGLLLVRVDRGEDGLGELRKAAELQAENSRYLYVYAVALNSLGQPDAAIRLLTGAKERFQQDFDIYWALATMLRDQDEKNAARRVAEEMVQRFPGIQPVQNLLESL